MPIILAGHSGFAGGLDRLQQGISAGLNLAMQRREMELREAKFLQDIAEADAQAEVARQEQEAASAYRAAQQAGIEAETAQQLAETELFRQGMSELGMPPAAGQQPMMPPAAGQQPMVAPGAFAGVPAEEELRYISSNLGEQGEGEAIANFLAATDPEGRRAQSLARMLSAGKASARRLGAMILEDAQSQMEEHQAQELAAKMDSAPWLNAPGQPPAGQQFLMDRQAGAQTLDRAQAQYVQGRDEFAANNAAMERHTGLVADLRQRVKVPSIGVSSESAAEAEQLLHRLEAELKSNPTAFDHDMYGRAIALVTPPEAQEYIRRRGMADEALVREAMGQLRAAGIGAVPTPPAGARPAEATLEDQAVAADRSPLEVVQAAEDAGEPVPKTARMAPAAGAPGLHPRLQPMMYSAEGMRQFASEVDRGLTPAFDKMMKLDPDERWDSLRNKRSPAYGASRWAPAPGFEGYSSGDRKTQKRFARMLQSINAADPSGKSMAAAAMSMFGREGAMKAIDMALELED